MRRTILPGLLLLGVTACGSGDRSTSEESPAVAHLRASRDYKDALRMAEENEQVRQALGTPLQTGTVWSEPKAEEEHPDADLSIRVFGPNGAGTLHVHAFDERNRSEPRIHVRLVVDGGKEIALSEK